MGTPFPPETTPQLFLKQPLHCWCHIHTMYRGIRPFKFIHGKTSIQVHTTEQSSPSSNTSIRHFGDPETRLFSWMNLKGPICLYMVIHFTETPLHPGTTHPEPTPHSWNCSLSPGTTLHPWTFHPETTPSALEQPSALEPSILKLPLQPWNNPPPLNLPFWNYPFSPGTTLHPWTFHPETTLSALEQSCL